MQGSKIYNTNKWITVEMGNRTELQQKDIDITHERIVCRQIRVPAPESAMMRTWMCEWVSARVGDAYTFDIHNIRAVNE